jgi:LacI family repressor for deo operon, udp, cdd, tsx, nupC, and nupG
MADVARRAGVSTATVSRVLGSGPRVTESTRARVRRAVDELGYVTNPHAASLASGRTRTIALLAPRLTSWYTSEVVAGIEEVLREHGFDLLIGSSSPWTAPDGTWVGHRFHSVTDGVIVVDPACGPDGAELFGEHRDRVVIVGEDLPGLRCIAVDNRLGGRLAADHLVGLGHREVAVAAGVVDGYLDSAVLRDRLDGFEVGLRAGGARLVGVENGELSVAGGAEAMTRLLEGDRFTAVFATTDEMAFGVLQALREQGIDQPISVIGFDDHPVTRAVGLSTIHQPIRDMGRRAARTVIGSESVRVIDLIRPTLEARASTRAP